MDDDWNPRLSGVRRSIFLSYSGFPNAFARSARYMAPEVTAAEADMDFDITQYLTKESDVFAFSMVALEVSNPPYA